MAVGVRSSGENRLIAPLRVATIVATNRIVMSNPGSKYFLAIIYIVRFFGMEIKLQSYRLQL